MGFRPIPPSFVNGGTLDVTAGFANQVQSLAVGPQGTLNLAIGNLLSSNGSVSLGGTFNLSGIFSAPAHELMNYPSYSGQFAPATGIPAGYRWSTPPRNSTLSRRYPFPAPGRRPSAETGAGQPNWSNGVPNTAGPTAAINAPTSTALTVTLDIPETVGTLQFGNPAGNPSVGYTLSGSNSLTLDNGGSPALITV